MDEAALASRPVILPELDYVWTDAKGSRNGHQVRFVALHRWGVRYTDPAGEAASYKGVISEFRNVKNQASAHIVYPGSAVGAGEKATQMVRWSDKAWTEAVFNPQCVEIECADAIWLGHDMFGLAVTARMTAFLLHKYGLPPVWVKEAAILHDHGGFCRHADFGAGGGGHTRCPTTDLHFWHVFESLVQHHYHVGGFRPTWGK